MVTIDYGNTNIISVPRSFTTFIVGKLYSLDTNAFRIELKNLEAGETGIVFPDTNNHNGELTVAGTTFARAIEILSPYSVEFEDLSPDNYSVQLEGSNNNIFDIEAGILIQNPVQVIPTNSAGLIRFTGDVGTGLTPEQEAKLDEIILRIWTMRQLKQANDALGIDGDKIVARGGQLQKKSESPFNDTIDTNDIVE